jgi:integrase/recombinase XerD
MATRAPALNPEIPPAELREHIENWLNSYRSLRTRNAFALDFEIFEQWMKGRRLKLHEVRRRDADRYRDWLETTCTNQRTGEPITASTVNRRVIGVSSLFRYLIEREEIYIRNPFVGIQLPALHAESQTVGLTRDEATRLIKTAAASDNPIEGALVWLLTATGLRIAEVCNANLAELHDGPSGMTISVRRKGDRPARLGVPGPAADAMRRYLNVRQDSPSGALFVHKQQRIRRERVNQTLKRLCTEAGVPAITAHGLRHTCATLMLDTGASIGDVQAQLGHRSLETTLRYDRARRGRADLAGNALTDALMGTFHG